MRHFNREFFRYPWSLLREPRVVSGLVAGVYFLTIINGILLILAQYQGDVIIRMGSELGFVMGGSFIVGSVLGIFSLHGGNWWMERACIFLNLGGFTGYLIALWVFSHSQMESLIRTNFTFIVILWLCVRFYKVRGATLDPSK